IYREAKGLVGAFELDSCSFAFDYCNTAAFAFVIRFRAVKWKDGIRCYEPPKPVGDLGLKWKTRLIDIFRDFITISVQIIKRKGGPKLEKSPGM
ncbi:MAG TPA: hypothetical protein VE954_24915, partial [Oligoflexus sp.]|uniref:hypothetical protein n=1 Tax=Oligoflexus sp. TaxID=1971216 RepID=UPI002D6D30E8